MYIYIYIATGVIQCITGGFQENPKGCQLIYPPHPSKERERERARAREREREGERGRMYGS